MQSVGSPGQITCVRTPPEIGSTKATPGPGSSAIQKASFSLLVGVVTSGVAANIGLREKTRTKQQQT